MLRASLRGSAKLRALQQQTPQQVAAQKQQALKGTLNEAYEPHEDETVDDSDKEISIEETRTPGITSKLNILFNKLNIIFRKTYI